MTPKTLCLGCDHHNQLNHYLFCYKLVTERAQLVALLGFQPVASCSVIKYPTS